jgi:colicin import membrane protein
MAEQKESSVLFSLKELMNLEQERIAQETSTQQRQAREARERRETEERAARDSEERRMREAEENRRAAEQRQREDAARLEAIKQAELERSKAETEHRAHLQAVAAQREHEAQLVKIRQDSSARRIKVVAIVAIAILGSGFAALGYKWKQDQETAARNAAAAAAEQQRLKEENTRIAEEGKKLQQQIDAAQAQKAEIEEALRNAKTDAEKARLRDQQRVAEARLTNLDKESAANKSARPRVKPKCDCTPGDPLCSCF